jgi:ABC-2 type transport system ATP-binding protein
MTTGLSERSEVITARGLGKKFTQQRGLVSRRAKTLWALKNVALHVKRGEFVGVIGPNGAGKSTLVKVLTGVLTPDTGKAEVIGYVPYEQRQQYSQHMGVVFGQRTQLWWDLPVQDSFELLKAVYNVPDAAYRRNMRKFAEVLGINRLMGRQVRKLSLGERMRCDLAASLLHNPEVIFLDEPTIGLDVEAKFHMRKFLQEINAKGATIILTTHDMGDIEELCERLIIVDHGKIVYDGSTKRIREHFAGKRTLIVDFSAPSPKNIRLPKGARVSSRDGDRAVIDVNTKKTTVSATVKMLIDRYRIDDLATQDPSVEEIIRHIYAEGL